MAASPAPACRARRQRRRPNQSVIQDSVKRSSERTMSSKTYSRAARNRSALPTTLTDDNAIAAAAMTGDSRMPKAG